MASESICFGAFEDVFGRSARDVDALDASDAPRMLKFELWRLTSVGKRLKMNLSYEEDTSKNKAVPSQVISEALHEHS